MNETMRSGHRPTTPSTDRGTTADRPSDIPARGWWDVVRRVKREIADDHSSLSAAGVAYYGFLAMVPALAALVSVLGLVLAPADVGRRVHDLFGALPSEAQQLLEREMSRLSEGAGGSLSVRLAVSIALALWSASSGMLHLMEAIGIAYDQPEGRGWIKRHALALGFTIGGLLVVVIVVGGLASVSALTKNAPTAARWLVSAAVWSVVAALAGFGTAMLYRCGPDRDEPKWRWVTPGSVLAVVVGVMMAVGLQVYVANFGSYDATYGSLAAVVLLLLWLYLVSLVVIIGAQLNAELEHQTATDTTEGPPRPMGSRDAVMADEVAGQ